MAGIRIVAFKDGHIHLAPDVSIPMTASNISPAYQPFKPGIFWTVNIIRYDQVSRKLITRISSYQGPSEQFCQQKPLPYDVDAIIINNITSTGLMAAWNQAEWKANHPTAFRGKNPAVRHSSNPAPQPVVVTKELSLRIPFSNLTYEMGSVSFEYAAIHRLPAVKINVPNPCVRPEFKFVVPYLAKVLKREEARFSILLKKTTLSGVDQSISIERATSPDINRITPELIENVNTKHVLDSVFKRRSSLDDEDILQPVKDVRSSLSNEDDPRQVLKLILGIRESKHHKQLQFLSTRHREDIANLRFTTDPVAFLFLLEGDRRYYFVLEAYDQALATYVWESGKYDGAIQAKLEELQKLMVGFRNSSRLDYRRSNPEGFSFIEHDYSDEIVGFQKWQDNLTKIIGA